MCIYWLGISCLALFFSPSHKVQSPFVYRWDLRRTRVRVNLLEGTYRPVGMLWTNSRNEPRSFEWWKKSLTALTVFNSCLYGIMWGWPDTWWITLNFECTGLGERSCVLQCRCSSCCLCTHYRQQKCQSAKKRIWKPRLFCATRARCQRWTREANKDNFEALTYTVYVTWFVCLQGALNGFNCRLTSTNYNSNPLVKWKLYKG